MNNKRDQLLSMSLLKLEKFSVEISNHLTIILVLNGVISIKKNGDTHVLKEDDILVINELEGFEMESSSKNLILLLQISSNKVNEILENKKRFYIECISTTDIINHTDLNRMRKILAHMMSNYFNNEGNENFETYQYVFELFSLLTKKFSKTFDIDIIPINAISDTRIVSILNEVQQSFEQDISLEQLSKKMNISYYYLSRLFKEHTGMTFTSYLTTIRLIHAKEDLIRTKESITTISFKNGFSTVNHFHSVFKKKYQITPTAYRKNNSLIVNCVRNEQLIHQYEVLERVAAQYELAKYLVGKNIDDENAIVEKEISIDVSDKIVSEYQIPKKIVIIGKAINGLDDEVQKELVTIQKELSFDYVNLEGFCEEKNMKDKSRLMTAYLSNNKLFDFFYSIGIIPSIELCLPNDIETIQEVKLWCDKQIEILCYLLNRYGKIDFEKWIIQWGRPNGFSIWDERSLWGYRYLVQSIQSKQIGCKIGLMTLNQLNNQESQMYFDFLMEQAKHNCLPDCIFFHADPYRTDAIKENHSSNFKGYQQLILDDVSNGIIKVNQHFKELNWTPPIYLTEWNTLVGEGDTLSGTFFRSGLIVESIIEFSSTIQGFGYWLSIKNREKETLKNEESSLSLFIYGEIKRPLFYSLKFLNRLSSDVISRGEGYVLTKLNDTYSLLIYNSNYIEPQYSVNKFLVDYQSKKIKLIFNNFPEKEYIIRHYTLDKDHGGIYNDWIGLGGLPEVDNELREYLTKIVIPKYFLKRDKIESETYKIETTLTFNACQLYIFQTVY